ncbi:MAG: rhodanese-like domain-containing protein [Thiolinea sp.]
MVNRSGASNAFRARVFDFDRRICQADTDLPHMLPDAETFAAEVRKLGVHQDSRVVVYDTHGLFSSPRAWWMFRAMGHTAVAVLDGGLPAWQRRGLALEQGEPAAVENTGNFVAQLQPQWLTTLEQVQAGLEVAKGARLVDARPAERFYAEVDEPRPGLLRGHIPGSLNLPLTELKTEQGYLRSVPELQAAFAALGLDDPRQSLVFSCGSGVAACGLALAADLLGYRQLSVYDGSWTEWGQPHRGLPVVPAYSR